MKQKFTNNGYAFLVAGAILATSGLNSYAISGIRLNEWMASNDSTIQDENGKAGDWVEIFNNNAQSVNIGGCYLTDSEKELTRFQFPNPTTIEANGYLIVWTDGTATGPAQSGKELHTNFSLSKTGEYLALVDTDGTTILDEIAGGYPEQYTDISFGVCQAINEYINDDSDFVWRIRGASGRGTGSVGFASKSGSGSTHQGFTVSYYELNVGDISDISQAETYISQQRYWKKDRSYPVVEQYDYIDFEDTSSQGHYVGKPFPTHANTGIDKNYFVIVATADIVIPTAGAYTFGAQSDDGFSFRITGNGGNAGQKDVDFICEYTGARSMSDTLATFNFPAAGVYQSRLIYFEAAGGAGVELYATPGTYYSWNNKFKRVGDTANGGLSTAVALNSLIKTNLEEKVKDKASAVSLIYTFNLDDLPTPEQSTLTLNVRYVDGFHAILNGQVVASANAPQNPVWSAPLEQQSKATTTRPMAEQTQWSSIDIPISLLHMGSNRLEVIALNDDASDGEFLFQPQLVCVDNSQRLYRYFTKPTPKAPNTDGLLGKPAPVTVSQPRGYVNNPFTLTLSTADTNATILYTLDGSEPVAGKASTYTTPLQISKTTVLRTLTYVPGHVPGDSVTFTWIFMNDVLNQSATPPTGWPRSGSVNGHAMSYGMSTSITKSPNYSTRIIQGFKDINTLSIVTDLDNLFDAQSGIYVNPGNSGTSWERPASIEMIDPKGGDEFQINAGLRIRGAASRSSDNPKHSFRVFFRGKYGQSSLAFPLFGDEGAKEFEKIDLRTEQNHSWHREAPDTYTAVREVFSRDSQRDSGEPYTRSRYYHLFLNGLYWGLYMTEERPDDDFASSYLGGESSDWDSIKTESSSSRATVAGTGNLDAWREFYDINSQGYTGKYADNYNKIKGLNPDGTVNPNYHKLLNEDNLIKFMINAYYTGDPDNPYSLFIYAPNNLFAVYNRNNPDGFIWFRHDAEHSLSANRGDWGLNMNYTSAGLTDTSYDHFNPITMHTALIKHPDYQMRFADIVQEEMLGDGIFTPGKCIERYRARMAEIDNAVIGESARWGAYMGYQRTRDGDWMKENNFMLNDYFPYRTDIVLKQFQNRGWFPKVSAATASLPSGEYQAGKTITINSTGSLYYTLDGTDPRLPGGGVNPTAICENGEVKPVISFTPQTLISKGYKWKFYDKASVPPAKSNYSWKAAAYDDSDWGEGNARLGFGSKEVTTKTSRNTADGTYIVTTYFRTKFEVTDTNGVTGLKINLNRDDGAVIYLNGSEVLRDNMPSGTVSYGTVASSVVSSTEDQVYFEHLISAARLRKGENTVAVELHQCNMESTDLYFDMEMLTDGSVDPEFLPTEAKLVLDGNKNIQVRAFANGVWSPIQKFNYTIAQDYDALRVSELMYSPDLREGDTDKNDDYAWIELCNTGANDIDLGGITFVEGIDFVFPNQILPAGEYLVLAKNADEFARRNPEAAAQLMEKGLLFSGYSGNFARKGETITIQSPSGKIIQSFTYDRQWYKEETDRTGYSIFVIDLYANKDAWNNANAWLPSTIVDGTPGYGENSWIDVIEDKVAMFGETVTFSLDDVSSAENAEWFHATPGNGWQKVADGQTLVLENITEEDAGSYMAKVLDMDASNAMLQFTVPAEIIIPLTQPQDIGLSVGETGTLSLNVLISKPEKIQWQRLNSAKVWEDVLGANGTSFAIEHAVASDAGSYRVTIGKLWTSDTATVFIGEDTNAPTIVEQPKTVTVYEGQSATFSVTVNSGTMPQYKWMVNGNFVAGATNRTYTINGCTLAQNKTELCCYVNNTKGTRVSSFAYLKVKEAPTEVVILQQPQDTVGAAGEPVQLSIQVTGTAPIHYQWYCTTDEAKDIPVGTDSETLSVENAGVYFCEITNPAGTIRSKKATVSFSLEPPVISILRGTSDAIIIHFEGRLQVWNNTNNVWEDVATESPYEIIPSKDVKDTYYRATR